MVKPASVLVFAAMACFITTSKGSSHSTAGASSSFDDSSTYPSHHHKKPSHPHHRKCLKPNEVFDPCPTTCPPQECGIDLALILCPVPPKPGDPECKPGCRCRNGFLRNAKGICVAEKDCPKCTKPNEVFDECPAPCPPRRCDVDERVIRCAAPPKLGDHECQPGCRCADGYVKNNKDVCVTRDQCPKCTNPHEIYDECPPSCPPQTCESLDEKYSCLIGDNESDCENCQGACRCEPGYYRNKIGECISEANCRKCNGLHEYFSCGGACDNVCATLSTQNQTHCPIFTYVCSPKCYCEEGYARDDNNICIPIKQCKAPTCGKNEVYSNCSNSGCGPKTCDQLGHKIGCVKMDQKYCSRGCICKEGYLRDQDGNCIPKTECPECGGDPNAVSGCGVNCGKHCTENHQCLKICYEDACDCRDGFLFDDNIGKCVRAKDCTPVCKANEVFSPCINGGCTAKYCSQVGKPVPCVKPKICHPGCLCREGWLRADNGICVPEDQCNTTCHGINEVFDTCANGGCRRWKCSQPSICVDPIKCEGGCVCQNGFSRSENNTCVREDQCDQCHKPHEYYDSCAPICPPQTCESIGKYHSCLAQPLVCRGACRCEKGYYRNKKGDCITEKKCKRCNKPHEYFELYPPICPPQTCDSIGKAYSGPSQIVPSNSKGECRCEEGYYRNYIGECISEEDCKKCSGPNEYFSCGGACDNVCATLNKQNQTNCPIINVVCNKMCYCEEGYARDENNICIPIDTCPEPKCACDERYEECPDILCIPLKCSQLGFPLNCTAFSSSDSECDCPGEHGCICDNGYVRDDYGNCVPKDQCPSCGGDPNAVSGCGNYCGHRCSDYKNKITFCLEFCLLNGCACRQGFVYDDNLKKCVHPKHCTPTCGINEVYNTCANGGCRRWNCTDSILCIDPLECKAGCSCQKGYSRDANGTCIPEDQCPDQCHKPHEYYDSCAPICPPQTCESIGKHYSYPAQPLVCRGACRCEKGYYRNKKGDCITKKECKKCSGPNEYFSCGGACDNVCATLNKQNQTNCPIRNIVCNKMCYCEEGYARDENNICIPIDTCPAPTCGINEVYDTCANGGCRKWNCSDSILCIDPFECRPGCSCQNGYSRDTNGTCIPEDQCPGNLCGPDERYVENPSSLHEPLTCSELGFPLNPPLEDPDCVDEPACICKEGYVRNNRDVCVPKSHCPSCGGDPNAVAGCGINCGKTCSTYDKDVACNALCRINTCDCKDGFVYDDIATKCVKYEECTEICD